VSNSRTAPRARRLSTKRMIHNIVNYVNWRNPSLRLRAAAICTGLNSTATSLCCHVTNDATVTVWHRAALEVSEVLPGKKDLKKGEEKEKERERFRVITYRLESTIIRRHVGNSKRRHYCTVFLFMRVTGVSMSANFGNTRI